MGDPSEALKRVKVKKQIKVETQAKDQTENQKKQPHTETKRQAKKSLSQHDPYLTYIKYKFELLKRNEEYQRDYQRLRETDPDDMQEIEREIRRRWGICEDPELPIDKYISFAFSRVTEEAIPAKKFWDDLISITCFEDKNHTPLRIDVSINAEAPWQLIEERLNTVLKSKHLFANQLTAQQRVEIYKEKSIGNIDRSIELKRKYTKRKQLPKKKLEPDIIELALKIYDLKTQQKMTSENIAKKLFPNETSYEIDKGNDSPLRKVNRYLRMARKMINTGKLW